MTPVYRWSGYYFGFIADGHLFDAAGRYLGWVEADGTVWRVNGSYLGELVAGEFILRRSSVALPPNRPARPFPAPPAAPPAQPYRTARALPAGYLDALDGYP